LERGVCGEEGDGDVEMADGWKIIGYGGN